MDINDKIIDDLIKHLELGKPILNKPRKPIGARTIKKYRVWLPKLSKWFKKPFNTLSEQDVDNFRKKLKDDEIRNDSKKPYKESVKRDIEQKFLKTLLNYLNKPELAYFISTYSDEIEVPALSKEEIEQIVSMSKLREKVIFQIMFDGGFRADEFLNIQFKDIKTDALKSDGYFKIRITKSKTLKRTVALLMSATTQILKEWLQIHEKQKGTSKPLVDISYRHLCLNIKRMGDKVLKKHLHPHILRHSSATHFCHSLNQYQLCKRYGWAINSNMPQRYIDREGIDDVTINKKIIDEQNIDLQKEINVLREEAVVKGTRIEELEDKMNLIAQALKIKKKFKS